jgi:cell division protein FtsN
MSDKNSGSLDQTVGPDTHVQAPEEPSGGFVNLILKKISDNKLYIGIGVAVIVLGLLLYYFYIRNKKETVDTLDKKPQLALPKRNQPEFNSQVKPEISAPFNLSPQEYFVLDSNGNPVKVSGDMSAMKQPTQPTQLAQPAQPSQPTQLAQPAQPRPRTKLEHPSDSVNVDVSMENESNDDNDDIENELARIKANEDGNVAEHDLTNSELAEINKKLEMMTVNNQ